MWYERYKVSVLNVNPSASYGTVILYLNEHLFVTVNDQFNYSSDWIAFQL